MKDELPNKLSELIDVALRDLISVERDKKYKVDMGNWHMRMPYSICEVCLAGAVMAKTLHASPTNSVTPDYYPPATRDKLVVLDRVRTGDVAFAFTLNSMHCKPGWLSIVQRKKLKQYEGAPDIHDFFELGCWLRQDYVPYENDPKKFKDYLRIVANVLEDIGL